jgi:hypothetical protein
VAPRAVEIVVGDDPARWEALGFALDDGACTVGGVRLTIRDERERGLRGVGLAGLGEPRPDGLPFLAAGEGDAAAAAGHDAPAQPNGAVAVDHVVALTDDLARTSAALEASGLPLRRTNPPQAFFVAETLVVELVESGSAPSLWGLAVSVADLDATAAQLGPLLGAPRAAVQPGRRIATVSRAAGLATALALMTPR